MNKEMMMAFAGMALAAGVVSATPETDLLARLPGIFKDSAEHYVQLDAAARKLAGVDKKGNPTFPHGYAPEKGEIDMRSILWWTSGHTPGTMWYLYEATGDARLKDAATHWTEMLAPNAKVTTNHDVGFIMYCSYGNARRILKTDKYDALLLETAESLSKRFNPTLGLIRSWGAIDEKKNFLVIPDNMMNLELLEWASKHGDRRFDKVACSHADVTMKHHFKADGGAYHVLNYDQRPEYLSVQEIRRGQGLGPETVWSRGQSWAIYGYSMMYRETGVKAYLDFAQKVADYAINHPNMPSDGVPYWDYGAPGQERDSSAASIMAAGLIEIAGFVGGPKGAMYRAYAVRQLTSLSSPEYFAKADEAGGFLLKHGVGSHPSKSEIDHSLNYGDYYYIEALLRLQATK